MKSKIPLKYKIMTAIFLAVFLSLLLWFFLSGENAMLLRSIFLEKQTGDELRESLLALGFRGYITIAALSMLQGLMAFLPAEPVQVIAGLSFGFPLGLLCCAIGVFLGNLMIYILYRVYGEKIQDYFIRNINIDFEKAATSEKIVFIIFILYFLPAIPYGMICFFAASVGMKYPRFALVTFLGSLPSVCIGVGLGNMAIEYGFLISLSVFLVLLALLAVALWNRKKLFAKVNDYIARSAKEKGHHVKFYKPSKLRLPYIISRIVFFFCGIRVRYVDRVGDTMQTPCVVLCNHGSFIDFAYAGSLLRKKSPNFIVARLYFYQKQFGKLLRSFGCFPKSMFALDLESMKNSLKVLHSGGILAMMPEARLSTVGRFEDIQPGTYSFLKKMNVPIYSIVIHGDYLADPKWGKGLRRGSLVEATLELLLSVEELQTLSVEEIQKRVEERLSYDEFAWLKTHPEIRYRSGKMAKGLENILTTCPVCGQKYTLKTKGKSIFCETCGKIATINERYAFVDEKPFSDFSVWYEKQFDDLRTVIETNEDYHLTSKVKLYRPSKDGKKMLRFVGDGVCTLDAKGLIYQGIQDGEEITFNVPIKQIYRLLFGAGENFEIYIGSEIYYFVPEERRSAVEWYMASMILSDRANACQ